MAASASVECRFTKDARALVLNVNVETQTKGRALGQLVTTVADLDYFSFEKKGGHYTKLSSEQRASLRNCLKQAEPIIKSYTQGSEDTPEERVCSAAAKVFSFVTRRLDFEDTILELNAPLTEELTAFVDLTVEIISPEVPSSDKNDAGPKADLLLDRIDAYKNLSDSRKAKADEITKIAKPYIRKQLETIVQLAREAVSKTDLATEVLRKMGATHEEKIVRSGLKTLQHCLPDEVWIAIFDAL